MDGLLFYWIGWIIWIVATFLMDKSTTRTWLAVWILLLIISASFYLPIDGIRIHLSVIMLLFSSVVVLAKTDRWFINVLKSFCIVFGYVGLLFWEQISPVWMFIPRTVMIPLIGLIFLAILSRSFKERCMIWCVGIAFGEIFHGLILKGYGFPEMIGNLAFLDLVFIEIGLLIVTQVLKEMKGNIDQLIQIIEKQKKRWT